MPNNLAMMKEDSKTLEISYKGGLDYHKPLGEVSRSYLRCNLLKLTIFESQLHHPSLKAVLDL
jgi:hypothetical protein